jgi:uncharacterized membrane protein YozB (DUF420 family)
MYITVFNASLIVGWLVFSGGAVMVHTGFGMAASGLMLVFLTLLVARMVGLQGKNQADT